MLSGTRLNLRLEGVKVAINTPGLKIIREHKDLPNLEYELSLFYLLAILEGSHLTAKIMIKEMKVIDYYKREPEKTSVKMLQNSASHNAMDRIYNVDQSVLDRDRASA